MKQIFPVILAVLLSYPTSISAVNYCATHSWGYGASATGGTSSPTLVTNESQLSSALNTKNSVIIITQNITVSNHISSDKSNITLMALPGVKLISEKRNQDESGILYLKGSNIILRNLTFEGPGAYDCDGWDLLCLDGAKNVWVDHCDFQDGCDDNFDIKGKADDITISWCRFRYLKEPKAGGSGDSDDHRYSNLIGSGSTDKPSDGTYNITFAYCWWDEGCRERMTRCRNSELHFLNCYWNSSVANYYVGPENASCYFEGCTFAGNANSSSKIWKPYDSKINGQTIASVNYCKFTNCTGKVPSNSGSVSAPSYAYDQLSASDAKTAVTNTTCGAGATLTVTNAAAISSSCDSGTTPGPNPQDTVVVSGDCCINLGLGQAPTVANGGVPSDFDLLSVDVNLAKGTWDAGFLNMGGNADYITFDFSSYAATIAAVEFDVTIPNWTSEKNTIAYHWNDNANTQYTISGSSTETVQLAAPANAKSFTIQRSAGTSTRISQVCFQIQGSTTDLEQVENITNLVPTQKILYKKQVYILRDGKMYNLLGERVL